jgi:hypothetical protein
MSFTNPQRIINKEFDTYINSGKNLTNNVAKTVGDMRTQIAKQKKYTTELQQSQDQADFAMRSKLNELSSTGNQILDENILSFWNEKVDGYFKIKNLMQEGHITRQEGNRELARISSLVPKFSKLVKSIGENSANFKTDLAGGNVSSVGSIENKRILDLVGKGGNVGIVEKNGELYLFTPQDGDNEPAMINGSQLLADEVNGTPMYQKKPNLSEPGTAIFNKEIQPDSLDGEFVEYVEVKKGDINPVTGEPITNLEEGKKYTYKTITQERKPDAIAKLVNSPAIATMVANDNMMARVWQDEIPDEEIERIATEMGFDPSLYKDAWHDYAKDMSEEQRAKLDQEQSAVMKQYLGTKFYNDNATMDNTLKFVKEEVYNPNEQNDKGNPYYMETVEDIYDFASNPIGNQNIILNTTIDNKTVNDVVVNSDGTITLNQLDYSLDEGTGGKVVDKTTFIGKYDPKDPVSMTKLAQQVQKSIGGNNKENNDAIFRMRKLYPAYYNKMLKERELAEAEEAEKGGFGGFVDSNSYAKWKQTNKLDKLSDEEKKVLSGDRTLTNYLYHQNNPDKGKEITQKMINEAEYEAMKRILELREKKSQAASKITK